MPFTQCPLCSKRYPEPFIAAHAASCNPSAKRPRAKPQPKQPPLRGTLYGTSPPKSSPPSETGAPGFHIFPAIFSDIEPSLLHHIHTAPPQWSDYRFRKSKNYGPPYNLRARRFLFGSSAPPQIPIPPFVHELILPRLRALPLLSEFVPNQLAVAKYSVPGGHILPHNDCENGVIGTAVVGVCLAARCTMTLILRARYTGLGKDVKKDVVLPRGAVYIMSGDALRVWEHAIFPRNIEATRYSLTFRDVSAAITAPSGAEANGATRLKHEGGQSSKRRVKLTDAEGHFLEVKTASTLATQSGVKRRRLIQQRLT